MGAEPQPQEHILDSTEAGPAAMRGGLLRTGSFVGGLIMGLASAPLVLRHLGDEEFGRFSAALAVIAIVAGLTEAGVQTVALRELSVLTERADRDRLMTDLLGLRLVTSSVGAVFAVAFMAVSGYSGDLVLGTGLAAIGMVFALTQGLLAVVLQAQLRFGWAAIVELLRGFIGIGLIIALVLAGTGSLELLAVTIPAGLACLIVTIVLVRPHVALRPAFRPARWMPLLRETVVLAVAVAVYALYFRVTLLVCSLTANAEETGDFAISFRIMEAMIGIPMLLVGAAFPIFARSLRDDRARFEYATRRTFELSMLLGGLLVVGLELIAPFAIQALTGDSDHPAVDVLRIQAPALVAGFAVAATTFPLLSMRRYRPILVANFASLVLVAVLAGSLAPSLGADGAAIAAVSADVVLAIMVTVALVRTVDGMSLPVGVVGVLLLASAVGLGAGLLVGVHPTVQATVGMAAYLGTLVALGRFPPELKEILMHRRAA